MDGLRLTSAKNHSPLAPCSRCQATGCPWDRIGEHVICPDCQELLALGEGEALIERLQKRPCVICHEEGSLCYSTFPLHAREPMEIDLCPRHFHAFLARRLDRYAFRTLSRRLQAVGLSVRQIFLLHEAFYDEAGHPLQPVTDF